MYIKKNCIPTVIVYICLKNTSFSYVSFYVFAFILFGDSPIPECLTSARLISAINVPGNGWIDHIANVKIGRLWVSDYDKILKEVDFENVIQTATDASCAFGKFDVTNEGFLLYVRAENTG